MLQTLATSHRVRPLPWPVIELLSATLRKLEHDIRNGMVASVAYTDVVAIGVHDPALRARIQRLRGYMLQPLAVGQCAIASLPVATDRPRTLAALRTAMATAATRQGVNLRWLVPDDPDRFDPDLTESQWCHVLYSLCQNALDAHAAVPPELRVVGQPEINVEWIGYEPGRLVVTDNGPGCTDLAGAATGAIRRNGGGHLGLGLTVIAALIERVGGSLTIATPASGGFCATVDRSAT